MKEEEKILNEYVDKEEWGHRIGSGDDEFYVQQVIDYVNKQRPFLIALVRFVLDKKSKVKNILKIPVKDRTEEQHKFLIETFHKGNVREYLLSMGEFKE